MNIIENQMNENPNPPSMLAGANGVSKNVLDNNVGGENMTAYIRLGNESVPADNIILKRMILRGTNHSYGSLISNYKFTNMVFVKLHFVCKHNTGKDFEDSDYEFRSQKYEESMENRQRKNLYAG